MKPVPLWLGALTVDPAATLPTSSVSTGRWLNPTIWDLLIIITVAVLLGSLLFLWAAYWRRVRRHRRHRSEPKIITNTVRPPDGETDGLVRIKKRRKFRHRRHDYPAPQRNPTLSETGGLPPVRTEESGETPK